MTPLTGLEGVGGGEPQAGSERRLAGSVVALFVLASLAAVVGPVASYRGDLVEVRDVFEGRAGEQAAVQAAALARYVSVLTGELARRAARPEFDPTDGEFEREQVLISAVKRNSNLFSAGLVLLSTTGEPLAGDRDSVLVERVVERAWWRVLRSEGGTIAEVDPVAGPLLVLAVPVRHDGEVVAYLAALADPNPGLKDGRRATPFQAYVRGRSGTLLALGGGQDKEALTTVLQGSGPVNRLRLDTRGRELFVALEPVASTGLSLAVIGDEAEVTTPLRQRFLVQMVVLVSLQLGALLLLALFTGRSYRRLLASERQVVDHARLVALGQASALIAHEVKNSLNGMKAAGSLIASGPPGARVAPTPEIAQLAAQSLRGEIDRLEHLSTSLLLFGKPASARRVPTELAPLVRGVHDALAVLPEAPEVAWTLDVAEAEAAGVALEIDPFLTATALQNVARNAAEAAVVAKDLGKQLRPAVRVTLGRDGRGWFARVEDNAGGVDPAVESKLFEPFTSGKPKGIGLGLSMSRRAMEAQGGLLEYARVPGGSRFTLVFPADGASVVGAGQPRVGG